MIKLVSKNLPKSMTIALSGGVDSVVAADFLSRKYDISCAFFHHGTEFSSVEEAFVDEFCSSRGFKLTKAYIKKSLPLTGSKEQFWRDERYEFLDSLDGTVITGHHLDDSIETYIFSALRGSPSTIPYVRNNVLRPFLLTKKSDIYDWARKNGLKYLEDWSNKDIKFTRNYIRHELMPHAFKVNPGLHKTVARIIKSKLE